MDRRYLVLTAVGPDRPGLVEILSRYIFERGGNVEGSRMATLGGEFATIMLVSGEAGAAEAIEADVEDLGRQSRMACQVRPTKPPREHRPVEKALPYELEVYSMDHPGIVRAFAHHLAQQGVNIESLETATEPAPHTGTTLFRMQARLAVPASTSIPRFRAELLALAEQLNVDVRLAIAQD